MPIMLRLARAGRATLAVAAIAAAMLATSFAARAETVRLVAFGDSLVAGYGLSDTEAFPNQLEAALRARGHDVEVINAGVSGDTTAGGLARLDWVIDDSADAVIVELGANDALRGLPVARARDNLDQILTKLTQRDLPILLTGMRAPSNWGADYRTKFDAMYAALADRHDVLLDPFFLEGVVQNPALNQRDGIHPNAAGVEKIVARMLPKVEALLAEVAKQRGNG